MKRFVLTGIALGLAAASAQASITPQLVASRTTGVAPLAVFFDSTGTVANTTSRPFHELSYHWDFGDTGSGTYTLTDGKSKNEARGPVAGHVFETWGTYNVVLTVRDNTGQVATQNVTIDVQNPDTVFSGANTRCYSFAGDFTDCPSGAVQVTLPSTATLSSIKGDVATGRRLLLRRGETIPVSLTSNAITLNVPGPGLIGAYGPTTGGIPDDPPPLIQAISDPGTAFSMIFEISKGGGGGLFSDWRIMDLDIDGSGDAQSQAVFMWGAGRDLLVLRLKMWNIGAGFRSGGGTFKLPPSGGTLPDTPRLDGLAIQDTEVFNLASAGNLVFVTGTRVMLLGNHFERNRTGEHILRTPWINGGVFSHNRMGEENDDRHAFKLHAPCYDCNVAHPTQNDVPGQNSSRIVISDNDFLGTTVSGGNNWSVAIGPENPMYDERLWDIIVERNFFRGPSGTTLTLVIWVPDVTVRDNVFLKTMAVERRNNGNNNALEPVDTEPDPDRVHVVHNTFYNSSAGVGPGFSDIRAANNFLVGGSGVDADFAVNTGNVTAANAAAAGFISGSPTVAADFQLQGASPAIGAGNPAYKSLWDYSGAQRTDAAPDAGAWEVAGPPDPLAPARPRNLRLR